MSHCPGATPTEREAGVDTLAKPGAAARVGGGPDSDAGHDVRRGPTAPRIGRSSKPSRRSDRRAEQGAGAFYGLRRHARIVKPAEVAVTVDADGSRSAEEARVVAGRCGSAVTPLANRAKPGARSRRDTGLRALAQAAIFPSPNQKDLNP